MDYKAIPAPLKAQLVKYGHTNGTDSKKFSEKHMREAFESVEGSLNSLSDSLKNRFKLLLVSQLSLLRWKERKADTSPPRTGSHQHFYGNCLENESAFIKRRDLMPIQSAVSTEQNTDLNLIPDFYESVGNPENENLFKEGARPHKRVTINEVINSYITDLESQCKSERISPVSPVSCTPKMSCLKKRVSSQPVSYKRVTKSSPTSDSSSKFVSSRMRKNKSLSPAGSPNNYVTEARRQLSPAEVGETASTIATRSPRMSAETINGARYSPDVLVDANALRNRKNASGRSKSPVDLNLERKHTSRYKRTGSPVRLSPTKQTSPSKRDTSPVRIKLISQLSKKRAGATKIPIINTHRGREHGTPRLNSQSPQELNLRSYKGMCVDGTRVSSAKKHPKKDVEPTEKAAVKPDQQSPIQMHVLSKYLREQNIYQSIPRTDENKEKLFSSTYKPHFEVDAKVIKDISHGTQRIGSNQPQTPVNHDDQQRILGENMSSATHADQQLQKKLLLNAIRTMICVAHNSVQRLMEEDFDFGIWAAIHKNVCGVEAELEKLAATFTSDDILPPETAVREAEDRLKTRLDVLFNINMGSRQFLTSEASRQDIMENIQLLRSRSFKFGAATQNEMLFSEMKHIVKEIKDLTEIFQVCGERFSKRLKGNVLSQNKNAANNGPGLSRILKKCFLGNNTSASMTSEADDDDDDGHCVRKSSSLEALTKLCCRTFNGLSDVQKAAIILVFVALVVYVVIEFLSGTCATIRSLGETWNRIHILRYEPPAI